MLYWTDLQSVHGLRYYGNTMEMRGRQAEPSGNLADVILNTLHILGLFT